MQTIVLHFCYFILILLFSTAYNTSLIYCFVRWCLHTNKRRPCSSTLSGHPSSSFWMWLLEDQSGPSHLGRYIEPCPSLFETMVMANGQSTGIYHDFSWFMMIYLSRSIFLSHFKRSQTYTFAATLTGMVICRRTQWIQMSVPKDGERWDKQSSWLIMIGGPCAIMPPLSLSEMCLGVTVKWFIEGITTLVPVGLVVSFSPS